MFQQLNTTFFSSGKSTDTLMSISAESYQGKIVILSLLVLHRNTYTGIILADFVYIYWQMELQLA